MSSQLDNDQSQPSPENDGLHAVSFDGFDKLIIVCLISVFVALFIWLLALQPFYSYLTFLGLLTLVLMGILRDRRTVPNVDDCAWGRGGGVCWIISSY